MKFQKQFDVKQIGERKTLELYLYGEIEADHYDWLSGDIIESTTSANYIRKAIEDAGAVDEINIYINSIGGSVSEGIAIFNILNRCTQQKNVYIDAYAYSIASVIAMVGDKVYMPSNTTMMIHNALMRVYGNSNELRKSADDLDVINEASCNSYLVKAKDKLTKEKLTQMLDAETFLTAEQALELGFCDEIINPVSLDNAKEVIEQAQRSKNPVAQKATQFLKMSNPQNTKPQETSFDVFEKILKIRNFI